MLFSLEDGTRKLLLDAGLVKVTERQRNGTSRKLGAIGSLQAQRTGGRFFRAPGARLAGTALVCQV